MAPNGLNYMNQRRICGLCTAQLRVEAKWLASRPRQVAVYDPDWLLGGSARKRGLREGGRRHEGLPGV